MKRPAPTRSRARMCGDKQRHDTPGEAAAHRRRRIAAGAHPGSVHVYECRHGGELHLHVGHRPGWRRR